MVLQNNVILVNGVPARMHFSSYAIEHRTITDPATRQPAGRNVLAFNVDELNGAPTTAQFSIMAEKLAANFQPYFHNDAYREYDFVITQNGDGYRRTWSVQAIPRTATA